MRITKKPDVRKQELIDLAKEMFLKNGYEKVSVREIVNASESMGSPGLFYYYFKSKKAIYEAVIDQMVDQEIEERRTIYEDNKAEPLQALMKLLHVIHNDSFEYQKFRLEKENRTLLEQVSKKLIVAEEDILNELITDMLKEEIISSNPLINLKSVKYITAFLIYGSNGILVGLNPDDDREEANQHIRLLIQELLGIKIE
ncbi:TetR family transcriptional regulator [Lactococcus hircilactis]|uniref:TetR family transcriptional regulator n=1 Tax=Lactococcus hircilactis TaxID=1494462 RepID=A0A7X2D0K9_9LACT|nr:TetR/AcrR family transcriptional regulator [Lactococcus hircilactis]MQW38527.1 TetR family transcriptional regulator [Lactococcus hircilactis]